MTWPFGALNPLSYDLVMADPPWSYENWSKAGEHKNASAKYDCMPIDAIKSLPVGQLARGDCILWLWATHPLLRESFDVMDAWGFRYVTSGVWVKTTVTGKIAFGTGYVLRSASEPFLIGTMGNPKSARNVRTVVMGQVREHSRKPEEAYQAAESLAIGSTKRADLFSRQRRSGWDSWGNETDKFQPVAATQTQSAIC